MGEMYRVWAAGQGKDETAHRFYAAQRLPGMIDIKALLAQMVIFGRLLHQQGNDTMIRRSMMRVALWSLAALVLLAAAGFLWLRQSPYWAGITLFSESHRVENFRDMGRVFPARAVARGETVWTFDHAPHLQPGDNPLGDWTFGYGYQWWIPEDPQGDFTAIGVWGQYVYVDPVREVVIVKTSADPEFDDNDHETIAAFRAIARAVAGE